MSVTPLALDDTNIAAVDEVFLPPRTTCPTNVEVVNVPWPSFAILVVPFNCRVPPWIFTFPDETSIAPPNEEVPVTLSAESVVVANCTVEVVQIVCGREKVQRA